VAGGWWVGGWVGGWVGVQGRIWLDTSMSLRKKMLVNPVDWEE
jgi:hypothetical protein